MPIYVQYSGKGINGQTTGKGPLHGLKLGPRTLTPKNVAFEIQSISPRDPHTGLASGKRQHQPFVIIKEVDSTSPLIHGALTGNQVIPKLRINFLQTNAQGNTQPYFDIELTNATLARYTRGHILPAKIMHSSISVNRKEYEEIEFTYRQIEWTYSNQGKSFQDDWASPT